MVSFTPRPLYRQESCPDYPSDGRGVGPRAVPYYCICIYKATHCKLEMTHCVFFETRLDRNLFSVFGGGFNVVRAIDMEPVQ